MLQPEQYLAWVYDEASITESPSGVEEVFEKAVKEWPTVSKLWLAYLAWLQDQERPLKTLRDVYEKAVTASGTAVKGGDKIWVAYRAMESLLVSKASNPKEEKQARERVLKLYRRQLSLPLEGNEVVMKELEENQEALGCDAPSLSTARSMHKDALKLLEKRQALEEKIEGAVVEGKSGREEGQTKVVALWQEYVVLEERENQVARLPGLYERALACCCSPARAGVSGVGVEKLEDDTASLTVEGWTIAEPLWIKYM